MFDSYLAGRTNVVRCNGYISILCPVPIGVPQGTVLGSILFILYANDLANNLSAGTCIMYADDITLFYSCLHKCVNEHRRVQRGGSGGPDPPLFLDPPPFICDPPPPTQPDLTDKCNVNCFLIV